MIPLTLFTADYRVPGSPIHVNPSQIAALNSIKQRAILTQADLSKPLGERPLVEVTEVHVVAAGRYTVTESQAEILILIDGAV